MSNFDADMMMPTALASVASVTELETDIVLADDPDDLTPDPKWLIGILIMVGASAAVNLGTVLQKLSHMRLASGKTKAKKAYKYPLWWVGFATFVGGNICAFFSYSFGPEAVLAPVGGIGLVINAILSRYLLKEHINRWDVLACCLILVGSSCK